ncbi:MAG TPA: ADP-ribosylglycohydrolase family protein [Bryobacteraceae bacterium]|nr:ADP-ribosylglycohydrolase family protein [Bryobacteraceae bacterium]
MSVRRRHFITLAAGLPLLAQTRQGATVEIPADVLEDKIRGGFLGQIVGDLNGLQHEMKYILEPGNVQEYTPALPDGGWTDDDTDVEWPYLVEIQKSGTLLIPYQRISEIWKSHINRRIWCSHLYLRQIMDLGIDPPLTGRIEINPWADFNLSGQFVSESWGLISPGMPRTAARIGIHYTHVSVDGEAVQSTQMVDAMIATAFLTNDMNAILDAGAAALDPESVMSQIMSDVRRWYKENARDWRATRKLTRDKYCKYGGQDMRDRNGVWLNGASTISALLYGDGDWAQTVRSAFNFGWDADNNAAASGTILGVLKGNKFLKSQGWDIKDSYRNTSRDGMPEGETITTYSDRLVTLARLNISEHGGSMMAVNGKSVYRINTEVPANVERLPDLGKQYAAMRSQLKGEIDKGIANGGTARERARAAYLAICLDFAPGLQQKYPRQWSQAIHSLGEYPRVLQAIFFEAPFPAGDTIRKKAMMAGLRKPEQSINLER